VIYTLSTLIEIMLAERADGLHLHPDEKPVVETDRNLFQISGPPIEFDEIQILLRRLASREQFLEFLSSGLVTCYHHVPGQAWFSVMAFREKGEVRLEIRAVR
jgi:Tfp pilus assembly pilus retraction ATPase PilT